MPFAAGESREIVTVSIGGQSFGLPIERVRDVFAPGRITRVPLAGDDIAGLLNLRGRIVTVVEARRRLGMPGRFPGAPSMAVGVECNGQIYGILVDAVGEVLTANAADEEQVPRNLDAAIAEVACAIHKSAERLIVVLDIDRLVGAGNGIQAA